MGYTHYWTQTRDFTADEMRSIGTDIRKILDKAETKVAPNLCDTGDLERVVLADRLGAGHPEIADDFIGFNGTNIGDRSHETFSFTAKRELPYEGAGPDQLGGGFCKTAQKPYDIAVTACLTYLRADWEFEISSDGDFADWEAGQALAEEALGREFLNPMFVEAMVG